MNHKQLLEHLAADSIVQAIGYDVARLTKWSMLGPVPVPHATVQRKVISKFFRRWNCALNAPDEEVTRLFREKVWVVAAVTLHKYGFRENKCTERAIEALDYLDREVALSDYFSRHQKDAKSLIQADPIPLKKRPAVPAEVTFWRAGDVVSYHLDGRYHVLYVHRLEQGNRAPLVEFFDIVLDRLPVVNDVLGARAAGEKFNDGTRRIAMHMVYGMRYNPDMANQFRLIEAGWDTPPLQNHLAPPVGLYTVSSIFDLPDWVDRHFSIQ